MAIGRTSYGGSGTPISVSFDGRPELKAAGVTIDWSTVAAVSGADLVTTEGYTIKIGGKYLRYGQVICRITTAHAQTITVSGTPTGGSFTLNLVRPDTGQVGTVTIPYNASVAAAQALFDASIFGSGNTVVSGSGALPGNVHTVTFGTALAGLVIPTMTLATNALTGGTAPTATMAVSAGATAGMYGPHDPSASDGRQTLTIGNCYILNESVVKSGLAVAPFGTPISINPDQVGGAIYGGRVWTARLIATSGSASLAAGPTYTSIRSAFPRLVLVDL